MDWLDFILISTTSEVFFCPTDMQEIFHRSSSRILFWYENSAPQLQLCFRILMKSLETKAKTIIARQNMPLLQEKKFVVYCKINCNYVDDEYQ